MKDGVLVVPTANGVPSWSREIYAVSAGHNFAVMTGTMTIDEIVTVMQANHGAKVFHWCGHATEEGLVVSRETIWEASSLLPTLRAMGYDLVFLNTCSSEKLGNRIAFEANVPVVIHGVGEILDGEALAVARNMYRQLRGLPRPGSLFEYYDAYVTARPDGGWVSIALGERFMSQFSPAPRRLSRLELHRTILFVMAGLALALSLVGLLT